MKIHTTESQGLKLSFSHLDTLHHWGKIAVIALDEFTGYHFYVDACNVSTLKQSFVKEQTYRYIASSQQLHLVLSNAMMAYLTSHGDAHNEGYDEILLSVASVNLNSIMGKMNAPFQFKIQIFDHQALQNMTHSIEFSFREGLHQASVMVVSSEQNLLTLLTTYSHAQSRNLDVMLEVAFATRVEIGTVVKTVKEIIEFTPGQIIELAKSIHEPLDVIVNKSTIAQGELVEVNGNYGLEITKVCQSVR